MSDTPLTDKEVARTARIGAMSGMEQSWQDVCYFASSLERHANSMAEAIDKMATLNKHHGLGPHCTCSQRERVEIAIAAREAWRAFVEDKTP